MTQDEIREAAFNSQKCNAPSHLPRKEREEIALNRAQHYYAGFEANTSVDCLLSWRYGAPGNEKAIAYAGLPVRQTFPTLPVVGDVLTFTPVLVALYGAGREESQPARTAKVLAVEPGHSNRFDYTILLEVLYDEPILLAEDNEA